MYFPLSHFVYFIRFLPRNLYAFSKRATLAFFPNNLVILWSKQQYQKLADRLRNSGIKLNIVLLFKALGNHFCVSKTRCMYLPILGYSPKLQCRPTKWSQLVTIPSGGHRINSIQLATHNNNNFSCNSHSVKHFVARSSTAMFVTFNPQTISGRKGPEIPRKPLLYNPVNPLGIDCNNVSC